jgi:AraC-like DNA-binding protein
VASTVFLSPPYFCKIFKRVTGYTLTEYLLRIRVDKAKALLIADEMTITEITFETGFEIHSYFDRIFHRSTNITPQEYREKLIELKDFEETGRRLDLLACTG